MLDIQLSQRAVYTLSTLLALILPLQGLFFAVLTDNYFEKKQKWNYLVLIFLVLCLATQNYAEMLACRAFRTAGVSRLHNEFETTRGAAYRIHKDAGFRETGTENGNVHLLLTKEEHLK